MPLVDRQLFLRRSPKYFHDHTIFRRSHNFPGSFPQLLQRSYNYTGNFSTIPRLRSPVRSGPPAVARQLRFPLSRSRTIHSPLMPPCNAPKSFHIFARRQIILYVYARRQIISFRTPPNHFETYSAESFQTKKAAPQDCGSRRRMSVFDNILCAILFRRFKPVQIDKPCVHERRCYAGVDIEINVLRRQQSIVAA